jgi:hypothetical protein
MTNRELKSERELNMIRGKMLVGAATRDELHDFLFYVNHIEGLLEEGDCDDVFGTEGWRCRLGWD